MRAICYSLFIFLFAAQAQISEPAIDLKPPFDNQGEQEDFWAQELFKNDYVKRSYTRYDGAIYQTENQVKYDDQSFILYSIPPEFEVLFVTGVIYPELICGYNGYPLPTDKADHQQTPIERHFYEFNSCEYLKISQIQELEFLSDLPEIKRFRFWLQYPHTSNPTVYFFELTNKGATMDTAIGDFLRDAKLTFLKKGWLIL